MATKCGKIKNTADIAKLKFGEDCSVPADLLFNNVPHAAWVSYTRYISLPINIIYISSFFQLCHSINLSIYTPIYLSNYLFQSLSPYLFRFFSCFSLYDSCSLYLSIETMFSPPLPSHFLFIFPSVTLSLYLFPHLSLYVSMSLSPYLPLSVTFPPFLSLTLSFFLSLFASLSLSLSPTFSPRHVRIHVNVGPIIYIRASI